MGHRTPDYQKKITNKGSKAFKIVCARRLQSLYRGYMARKEFRIGLKSYYRQGKGDNRQRKKFYEKELSTYADSVVNEVNVRKGEIDSILKYVTQYLDL